MHTTHMQETSESKRHIQFYISNENLFLGDLERDLCSMAYNNHIDTIYYHFTTTISIIINKFSNETSYNKKNRATNPWYEKHCKIARKDKYINH